MKNLWRTFTLVLLLVAFCRTGMAQQKRALTFAVVTDTHIGKSGNDTGLASIVKDINGNPDIHFVLHAGDVSDFGYNDQLGKAKELMDGLNKPYFIVPGNHDTGWSASGGLVYNTLWKEQKFVTDIEGVRIIGFSTGPYGRMSRGYVPLDQMRWLDSLVQATPKKQPVFFISHYPLDEGLSNYSQVIDKLHQLNTLAVFCGHGHVNKLYDYDGVPGIMTRTAQVRQGTLAYNIFTLTPDSLRAQMKEVGRPLGAAWASLSAKGKRARTRTAALTPGRSPIAPEHKQVRAVWTYQDKGNIVSTPAIWKDQVLLGNLLGEFKSLNPKKNRVNWSFNAGQGIYASPVVTGNRVIFASSDSSVYCLNARTGKLLWRVKTQAPVLATPTVEKGTVYIGSSDSTFRALDIQSGKVLWAYKGLEGFPASQPTVAEGKVVFGTWGKTLYALNSRDGSLAWTWKNLDYSHYYSPAMCVPVIQNKKVYMVAPDEKLRQFDLETGEQTFTTARYRVRESLGGQAEQNLLVAKTMQDSVVVWSTKGAQPEPVLNFHAGFGNDFSASMPVIQEKTAFFGTTFGRVYAVELQAGKVSWVYQASEDMINTVRVLPNGKVLAASVDGKVVLLEGLK
ncbi:PQQ-binding-like beta-propeller repeat protein [Rufibacter quisquiliarum]|uniref:Outer membrane protein assembly factor BamB n=1 Tax=Rufibacter quisquiliarum TaxID=1549639 RepID=A0A839GPR4_9BACT|nr:PQQ-binding-like beta-propeller repeat protein [Rufibacter quisquiliarum]MBA9076887.1 outer membrane protein assembly factor BamB [Rufibacter quisquiliarum]